MNEDTWGKVAYDAYRVASDYKSLISGVHLPAWADLRPDIRTAWNSAAQAVREAVRL